MKSLIIKGILIAIFSFLYMPSETTFASDSKETSIRIIVNETAIVFCDAKPFYDKNGRVQVPLRFVSEAMGAKVQWDGITRKVTVTLGGDQIELSIGKQSYTLNGQQFQMDTSSIVNDGTTFVPIRFVGQALGALVTFDTLHNTIHIETANHDENHEQISINEDGKSIYNGFIIDLEPDSKLLVSKGLYDTYGSEYTLLNIEVTFNKMDTDTDYKKQYKDVEEILLQKVDSEVVAAVMKYLSAKSTAEDVLPPKEFKDTNYKVIVSSRMIDDNINIFVFKN
ncbi:copper amine oxidase N-terminal domain-containing protein [Paenibacillus glycanilyticus]|uniref:stalk domain-containing protein n=1 Tax=Paenibacillus glycanilyticus TaxID=126569 RepID=UPI00203FEB10|nr:stalk domain-containing protein [Paenibacillus glycanilyticus]MCM3629803.1 copper amine oxidase N-terminal domain-containing protein [Paenibacillus glycanilyticus]